MKLKNLDLHTYNLNLEFDLDEAKHDIKVDKIMLKGLVEQIREKQKVLGLEQY